MAQMLDAKDASVNDFGLTFYDLFIKALTNALSVPFDAVSFLTTLLDKRFCYTFELVSPESRVVVRYKEADLYFIGFRDVATFEELNPDESAISNFIKRPKEYELNSLNACLQATERMGYDEEGFVVVDKYWNRIKVKSPAYVIAAHLRENGNVSKDKILTIIERGEQDEFLGYFPEYKEYFDDIQEKRNKFFDRLNYAAEDIDYVSKTSDVSYAWTRKDFAKYILDNYSDVSQFLFKFLDTDLIKMFIQTQWDKLPNDKKIEFLDKEN